jgi:hypothetical protein
MSVRMKFVCRFGNCVESAVTGDGLFRSLYIRSTTARGSRMRDLFSAYSTLYEPWAQSHDGRAKADNFITPDLSGGPPAAVLAALRSFVLELHIVGVDCGVASAVRAFRVRLLLLWPISGLLSEFLFYLCRRISPTA